MASAASTFPGVLDTLQADYDPNIGPAVAAMQQFFGGYIGPTSLTGVKVQTFPDELATGTLSPTSGTVNLSLVLAAGTVISKVNFITAAQAAVTPTHSWAGISSYVAGSNGVSLAAGADQLTAAMAADTVISLPCAYTVPTSGLYWVYFCIVAGTTPSIAAAPTVGAHGRGNVAPFFTGPGATGQTTPTALAGSVTAPTATAAAPLLYLN